jgi:hypothetical protein
VAPYRPQSRQRIRLAPIVPTLLGATGIKLQQQTVCLHDPVEPLVVGWWLAPLTCLAYQMGMHPPGAINRQTVDDDLDGPQILIRLWRLAPAPRQPSCGPPSDIGASDLKDGADGAHGKPPLGARQRAQQPIFGPVATSKVFLPSRRWRSRIWFCRARYSEAATTSSWALVAVSTPWVASLRQRATKLTVASGS